MPSISLSSFLESLCDLILEFYNPCHIEDGGCLRGNPVPCCLGRIWNIEWRKETGGCVYLVDRNCTNPNLKCKSYVCRTAIEVINPDCLELLKRVEDIGKKNGLIGKPFLGHPHCT